MCDNSNNKQHTTKGKNMFQVKQKITTLCEQEFFLVFYQSTGKWMICERPNMISRTEANAICNKQCEGQYNYIIKKWEKFSGKREFIF